MNFESSFGSSFRGHVLPRDHRFTAELTKAFARDEVSLNVEGIVDGGVGGEKSLR